MKLNSKLNRKLNREQQEHLFKYTLDRLKKHQATRSIPEKLLDPLYNQEQAKKICSIVYELGNCDFSLYDKAINHFISYSQEFLQLQIELERTGKYFLSSYNEAQREVYQNQTVMENRYLNGLLLSQALWINHHQILQFFIKEFCISNKESGQVIEAPVGSGIFISEFATKNKGWTADAYDISPSSINFARKVLELTLPGNAIYLGQKNIFDLPEEKKYDRVICGELLEHLEEPEALLRKLKGIVHEKGSLFLTTAIWAAAIDHIYLFKSAEEVRKMLRSHFKIEKELVLNVFSGKGPDEEKTPINYACILRP